MIHLIIYITCFIVAIRIGIPKVNIVVSANLEDEDKSVPGRKNGQPPNTVTSTKPQQRLTALAIYEDLAGTTYLRVLICQQ